MVNDTLQYADLILPLPLEKCYTYFIPVELRGKVIPGVRVTVQFGQKKYYAAIVRTIHNEQPETVGTKSIESLIDQLPIVPEKIFPFWEWIAGYYHCSIGEIMKAALPSGLKMESETLITFNKECTDEELDSLNEQEKQLYYQIKIKKSITVFELNNLLSKKSVLPLLKELLAKEIVLVEEEIKDSYRPKKVGFVKLGIDYCFEEKLLRTIDLLLRVPKQKELLLLFLQLTDSTKEISKKIYPKKEFLKQSNSSISVLEGLVNKGILAIEELQVDRMEKNDDPVRNKYPLSEAQLEAYSQIKKSMKSKIVTLLHGVTSSGKTEIFIELIGHYLAQGKQVLYLLPEIGLTTQMIDRLISVFGKEVGVYHSRFNDAERVEIWNNVLDNTHHHKNLRLIVGTRSAIFLPFTNLGMIIVDEEHENSYKQFDPAPRYHARDAAIVLGNMKKIPVILGTATPSVESYFNAKEGKYGLVELKERYLQIEMPEIITADLKEGYKRKTMRMHLTDILFNEISQALTKKEQVILFQNRRGFSPFVECKRCGWVPKCRNCDVSLTFHKYENRLVCHYCGFSLAYPGICGSCSGKDISNKGFGTEQIEEELYQLFPGAAIERLDLDATRTKRGFREILKRFESGETDILVGTQMITKGLDFSNVSIVGILNADNLLFYPDFRAHERSFQLMTQVSGRSGRRKKQGKVIIQTSDPKHPIINQVVENDFEGMYQQQIKERKEFNYPPFCRMIRITLRHREQIALDRIAGECAVALRTLFGSRLLGPEYPSVNRIKLNYLKQLWLKLEREISVSSAKKQMQSLLDGVRNKDGNKSLQIVVDVDPM